MLARGHVILPARRQVLLSVDLINFTGAQHYSAEVTPKDRMDFKGQQHLDMMSFF